MCLMVVLAATILLSLPATAQTEARFAPFITSTQAPMQIATSASAPSRLFVVERAGLVRAFDADTAEPVLSGTNNGVVLDLRSHVRVQGDGGMLSAAFPDDFATSGIFYVFYNRQPDNANVLARFRITPGTLSAPLTSEEVLLVTPHNNGHNGGWSGLSPIDGYLYLSLGDDGTFDNPDPLNRAQTITGLVFNGKILRLDVSRPGDDFPTDPNRNYRIPPTNPFVGTTNDYEIWSYGLRNPWRCGFDMLTGDFWIGDVGQDLWEEVIYQPAGNAGGQNYGWRCMEGPVCTPFGGCTCNAPSLLPALFQYGHNVGCSISPGAVYRGASIPEFQGLFFYSDFCTPGIWTVQQQAGAFVETVDRTAQLLPSGSPSSPVAISNDARGDLYLLFLSGQIYKLTRRCDSIDFNNNSLFPEDQDLIDFFSVLAGGDCSTNTCNDIDFNNDGLFPSDDDLVAFLRVLAGGNCV